MLTTLLQRKPVAYLPRSERALQASALSEVYVTIGGPFSTDVDDLEEISDLQIYIKQSAAINMFLSHGYFKSRNCLREVQGTLDKKKKFMLTHEADTAKGGGPLDKIKAELDDEKLRDVIFSEGQRLTVLHAILHQQLPDCGRR